MCVYIDIIVIMLVFIFYACFVLLQEYIDTNDILIPCLCMIHLSIPCFWNCMLNHTSHLCQYIRRFLTNIIAIYYI